MKKDKTEIIIILDKSGSMQSIKNDMSGAIKNLIEKQKELPGECVVSLYQFDTYFQTSFEAKNIKDITSIDINPAGGTALYDAFCNAVDIAGKRLKNTHESERPERVIVVCITDGEENSSISNSALDVKSRIKHQSEKYNWKFEYLGANQDAITNGLNMGFGYSSSITYNANNTSINNVAAGLTSKISSYRALDVESFRSATIDYSDSDRKNSVK